LDDQNTAGLSGGFFMPCDRLTHLKTTGLQALREAPWQGH
jgi:hypothetical protein